MSFVFHCKKTSLKKYWLCLDTATRLRHSLFIWFLKWTWWKMGWNMARLLLECDVDYVSVWIQLIVASAFLSCRFLFLFFFGSAHTCWLFYSEQCIRALFRDPQILLFSKFFIKNRSHSIIYTFKNYFATMFSVSTKISSIQTDLICHLVGICHLYDVNPIIQLG